MSRWFRMYDELLDDPKVQLLSPADFRGWVNLLCLASRNDGRFPSVEAISFALRETQDAVSTLLERLLSGGLIERRSGGADGMHYAPYKWGERQYKSDTSTIRVKRFRERSKPTNETAPETETEAETEEVSTNVDSSAEPTDKPLTETEIVEAWNSRMVPQGFPAVRRLTNTRKTQLRARMRENTIDDWQEAMAALERSPFCRGDSRSGWKADFDFLLQPKSFTKLLEGAYDH